jgi:hypothetical protein
MDLTLARKWNSLGIPVMGMYLHQIDETLKFASKAEDLDAELLEEGKEKEYNCLALFISDTPMMCLDVDNVGESITLFHQLLKKNKADISDYFYETTVNGGLHLYFLNEGIRKNVFRNINEGICFDVLSQGRVFTSPTTVGDKKYRFGEKSPLQLNSIAQIGKMPDFLKDLIKTSNQSGKIPTPSYL